MFLQISNAQENHVYNWQTDVGTLSNQTGTGNQFTAPSNQTQDFTNATIQTSPKSEHGCTGEVGIKVLTIERLPQVTLPDLGSLNWQNLENRVYEVSGRPGSGYHWQAENGQITAGQGSNRITVNWLPDRQPYSLTVTETTRIGCEGSSQSSIIDYDKTLFIPNIITPNADGQNDYFEIKNLSFYPNSSLSIYNRWGKEVFRTDNYQNNWQTDQTGTYFFVLTVEGKVWKGVVSVVR
jgi:gliding motility-associated-like protein